MRAWWLVLGLASAPACSNHDDTNGPGEIPDVPASLASTTLDGAVALTWSDNSYAADPGLFQNYRVYSTSYDLDNDACGTAWRLEGTTVAPEFVVGALDNGVPRCFSVTSEGISGGESGRSPNRADTPRPESRNVVLYAVQAQAEESGFRFWSDANNDGLAQESELGVVGSGGDAAADFYVDRAVSGDLFLTPRRDGTGVELYDAQNSAVDDLTSIDFAPDITYSNAPIQASPGAGYVFETDGGDGFKRFGALRVTHVGTDFLIADWAFQTDPGNPELRRSRPAR